MHGQEIFKPLLHSQRMDDILATPIEAVTQDLLAGVIIIDSQVVYLVSNRILKLNHPHVGRVPGTVHP